MNTGGDQWWVNQNAPEILAQRGFSASAVQAARRFYNGQVTPAEFLPTLMKFMSAYFYRLNLLEMVFELLFGPRAKNRPEPLIFGYSQLLKGWSVMDRLGEIQVPTLVLAGRHDFLFPPEHQAILADRLPDARLELVECASHNPHMERPAEVIAALQRFLAAADPGAAKPAPALERLGAVPSPNGGHSR
jgi:proline iminopeptidase